MRKAYGLCCLDSFHHLSQYGVRRHRWTRSSTVALKLLWSHPRTNIPLPGRCCKWVALFWRRLVRVPWSQPGVAACCKGWRCWILKLRSAQPVPQRFPVLNNLFLLRACSLEMLGTAANRSGRQRHKQLCSLVMERASRQSWSEKGDVKLKRKPTPVCIRQVRVSL